MRGPTPIFFFVLLLLQLGMNWLVYRLLIRFGILRTDPYCRAVYWSVVAFIIVILYSGRLLGIPADFLQGGYSFLVSIAYAWTISQLVFAVLGALCLSGSWLVQKATGPALQQSDSETISRRDFLKKSAAIIPLAAVATGAGGVYTAMNDMALNRYVLKLPNLPLQAEELTVAQLSDLHVGPFFGLHKLESAIEQVRQEKPDIVVITGDFIDELTLAEEAVKIVSQFAAEVPLGIYFCWGNHEYFRDKDRIAALLKSSAIQVLDNSSEAISAGGRPIYLIGVDYPWADRKTEQRDKRKQYLTQALQGIPDGAFRLLISHHPDFIEEAFAAGIPLTLTGHTHGGQVAVFGRSLLPVQYRFMRGMYQSGDYFGYVHTGTGHWFPFRVGCPPEIAMFTLKPKYQS